MDKERNKFIKPTDVLLLPTGGSFCQISHHYVNASALRSIIDFPVFSFNCIYKPMQGFLYGKTGSSNTGIDLGAEIGTPVYAAAAGEVTFVGKITDDLGNMFGNYVLIYHGETKSNRGIRTIYAHNSEVTVETGQKVKRGEEIGRVGNTGLPISQDGGVLHFEIREFDTPLDPEKILPSLR